MSDEDVGPENLYKYDCNTGEVSEVSVPKAPATAELPTAYCGDYFCYCGYKVMSGSLWACHFSGYCDFQRPRRAAVQHLHCCGEHEPGEA
jgi:hypothetical protein